MFNLFDMMGFEVPEETQAEKKAPASKKVEKKEPKKQRLRLIRKPEAKSKNVFTLPGTVHISCVGDLPVTTECFEDEDIINDNTVLDTTLKKYISSKYPFINDSYTFVFDKSECFVGFVASGVGGTIEIAGDASVRFGEFSLDLAELSGGELTTSKAESKDLAMFIANSGLPLGNLEAVKFKIDKKTIVPIPATATEDDLKTLCFPFVIHMYGDLDNIEVSEEDAKNLLTDENKTSAISKQLISDIIVAKYPYFKNKVQLCAVDSIQNMVCCYLSVTATTPAKTGKKEDKFTVNENTIIKFFSSPVNIPDELLPAGEYTLKQLCKVLVQCGIVECNDPGIILAKQVGDSIIFCVKFGGSKGAKEAK